MKNTELTKEEIEAKEIDLEMKRLCKKIKYEADKKLETN